MADPATQRAEIAAHNGFKGDGLDGSRRSSCSTAQVTWLLAECSRLTARVEELEADVTCWTDRCNTLAAENEDLQAKIVNLSTAENAALTRDAEPVAWIEKWPDGTYGRAYKEREQAAKHARYVNRGLRDGMVLVEPLFARAALQSPAGASE